MPSVRALPFRKSEIYKKKLSRIGAALRVFSNVSGADNNFNSLANEAAALEELSLSAFSLMKAIKQEIEVAAKKNSGGLILPSEPSKSDQKLIVPPTLLDNWEDDGGGGG